MVLQTKITAPLFSFLLIICFCHSNAQAVFKATITPGSIGKNETATLRLIIDNANQVEQIVPPGLGEFTVLSGPNQESGMEINNGVTRQYIGITYLLQPKSVGKFSIAGAKAVADGKVLTGNPVTLTVTKNGSGKNSNNAGAGFGGFPSFFEPVAPSAYNDYILKKGENLSQKISKNIFLKVATSKTSCYVGEPVVVTYKLYTRLKSESSITKNPSFNGFSVIDLLPPGNTDYSIEQFNGREYNVYILRKSQVYPLQAGSVELETAEVDNTIHFIKEAYFNGQRNEVDDLLGGFTQLSIPPESMLDEKITLQSKPVTITVKPLPELGRPISFKGAVGKFTVEAALQKNSFTTADAGKLTITIAGAGNMSMILAPEINWPAGIEGYDPKTKDQLDKLSVPVSGSKIVEYAFTVSQPGTFTIAPIDFSYFDAVEGKYITLSTAPQTITVTQGTANASLVQNKALLKQKSQPFSDGFFINRWFILLFVAFVLAGMRLSWIRKTNKKNAKEMDPPAGLPVTNELPPIMANRSKYSFLLSEEKMMLGNSNEFYPALNGELRTLLSTALQIPLETISKKTVEAQADRHGVALHTRLQIQQLLDDIEWQLYTPMASENSMESMYKRATAIEAELAILLK